MLRDGKITVPEMFNDAGEFLTRTATMRAPRGCVCSNTNPNHIGLPQGSSFYACR
jgi:hypothetical protein